MAAIGGRGEVDERAAFPGAVAGTQRLRIVDRDRAVQPWRSADGSLVLCFNGEIFNHDDLRAQLRALGHEFRSESDTEVVLEAFREWGPEGTRRLRGEFAFAILDLETHDVYLSRDPIGVKPLYYAWRHGRFHVASEVKALVGLGSPIHEVAPGHHGSTRGESGPVLVPHFELFDARRELGLIDSPETAIELIRSTLDESIRIRMATDLPVGVVLSGGLDSSLVLTKVHEQHPDCVAFTIGTPGSEDLQYARRLTAELGVRHEVITMHPGQIGLREIRRAIRMGELTEYGDVINAIVSIPLFARVQETGIKIVLTGDGSDELFGGYPMYHEIGEEQGDRLFAHKLLNLGRTELQRVDRSSMGQGVETRVPFLDREMIALAMRIPLSMKTAGEQEKWLVREAFRDILPDYIVSRPKAGMSYSSGLHDRARLFKPLFPRLHRRLSYDLHAPIRRDFDTVLSSVGNDLDLAMAAGALRTDYTPAERARDLLGAVRWNVQAAIG
ncbi:asparagine synthetase B family protein [Gordonia phthalatica]|uniref:asparagine synthase (glutamine-hydrolyzing) n=1 Tax=Gordonia phthalatica TaxID=1136941 RepID=A0A0N7FU42_9ACTN|nr:asparagine synthase-related protein [Gordonia phthalatica]ALG83311.1 asparagine synthase [Gordonia phthalatica]